MNEVSIIINGVRYDMIESKGKHTSRNCHECDLLNLCENIYRRFDVDILQLCVNYAGHFFKKSTKSFER